MKNLFIIFFLILPYTVFAQEEEQQPKTRSIQLNWGIGNLQIQNISASPMIHKDWSPVNFALRYERSKKLEQQFYVKFSQYEDQVGEPFKYSAIYTDDKFVSTIPHSFVMLDLSYSLGKQILDENDWKLTLGGRSSNCLSQTAYDLGPSGSGVYYFSLGLDAWLNVKYDLGEKSSFVANFALPIFSWATRSPYLSADGQYIADNSTHKGVDAFFNYLKRGEIQSWGKRQSFNFDLSYYYSFTDKWQLGAAYGLTMHFNQEPQRFGSIENIFQLSGKFNF